MLPFLVFMSSNIELWSLEAGLKGFVILEFIDMFCAVPLHASPVYSGSEKHLKASLSLAEPQGLSLVLIPFL